MTACLPFSKIKFLTVNPRTGYILFGFIMIIIIYCYQDFYYLNDIGTDPLAQIMLGLCDFLRISCKIASLVYATLLYVVRRVRGTPEHRWNPPVTFDYQIQEGTHEP